jgi:hypothetical protein
MHLDEDEVERARLQPAVQRPALVDGQFEVELRVALPEVAEDPGELGHRQVVGRSEAEASAHRRAGEVALGRGVGGEDGPREPGHRVPVVGEPDGPRVPDDEPAPRGLLEAADLLADRRLAQPELRGRPGEVPRLGDGQEGAEERRVEHGSPIIRESNRTDRDHPARKWRARQ